jgi:hypothetical protein
MALIVIDVDNEALDLPSINSVILLSKFVCSVSTRQIKFIASVVVGELSLRTHFRDLSLRDVG